MDNSHFYDKGFALAKEAVAKDTALDVKGAIASYMMAVEQLAAGLKFEKDDTRAGVIRERAMQYMARANELRTGGSSGGSGSGAGGGTATASKGKTDDSADAEASKLKGALAGAIVTEKPNVKWDDVAGLEAAKDALKEAVILPYKFPQLFTGKVKPWKGILLYGPPGTGKSYLAKAVATEADATFFSVSSSDLVSKWQGESERLVKNLFEMAREKVPSIIFIDEIDSLCGARGEGSESESARRIKTEFLVQMQGVSKGSDGLLVLAATNTPWEIDPAMRRRFEKRIYIPLPEPHARERMFAIHIGDTPNELTDGDVKEMAKYSEGFSGSDVSVCVREALMEPLRKCRTAKYWQPVRGDGGKVQYTPTMLDPPCGRCPVVMPGAVGPDGKPLARVPCPYCHCVRMSLYDLASDELKVPLVCAEDFARVLGKTKPTVALRELDRFVQFTKEFGSDGS